MLTAGVEVLGEDIIGTLRLETASMLELDSTDELSLALVVETAGTEDVQLAGVLVATGTVLDADPQLKPME